MLTIVPLRLVLADPRDPGCEADAGPECAAPATGDAGRVGNDAGQAGDELRELDAAETDHAGRGPDSANDAAGQRDRLDRAKAAVLAGERVSGRAQNAAVGTLAVADRRPARPYATWRPTTLVKKARVREAAARLLSRATIHSVTPEDVSLAAGLTKSSCYYYYGTRDALLADTLIEHLVALDAAVCAAFDATAGAEAPVRMTALAHAFLRVALAQRDAHLALRLNAKLVSDARRPSVMARSRQVTATLRMALEGCVPGLDGSPDTTGLLMRQFVGGLSEAVTWFKPDSRVDSLGLAGLIACQVLMTARAFVAGEWLLPPPAPSDDPSLRALDIQGRADRAGVREEGDAGGLTAPEGLGPALAAWAGRTSVRLNRRGMPSGSRPSRLGGRCRSWCGRRVPGPRWC